MTVNNTTIKAGRRIAFSPPDISEAEIKEVAQALRSGWITTGPRTKRLEKELAAYIGTNKAVCLSSATAAEELILRILGIGPGDEVIVPAYTYTSTAAAVIHTGAKAVFIDSQPDRPEMDYDAVERAVTPSTKAIIPVDLGGVVCDYDRLYDIVKKSSTFFRADAVFPIGRQIQEAIGRVLLIADCAHALGAERLVDGRWRKAGDLADFSFFSFHAVKNFTTAEGGAAVWRSVPGVDDERIYHIFQLMSLHGQSKDALAKMQPGAWEYDIVGPWYKCNMTDVMAAIGIKQLERYPKLLERRLELSGRYDRAMEELGIHYLVHRTPKMVSSGHLYITRIPGIHQQQRNAVIDAMARQGVACNVHYKPLPLMSGYQAYVSGGDCYPNAVHFYENEITLPLHTLLSDEDVEYVIEQYQEIVRECLAGEKIR